MIDYGLLNKSVEFYESMGFSRIESPWTVTEEISDLTSKGRSKWHILHKDKVLVASGEQSFLYLYNKSFLPKGKFQTITPCFRDDKFDLTHTKYFMKNELIDTLEVTQGRLEEIVDIAKCFFETLGLECDIISTDEGYDIEHKGVEIGSYGIRSTELITYIYATGLAEPRTSRLITKNKGL